MAEWTNAPTLSDTIVCENIRAGLNTALFLQNSYVTSQWRIPIRATFRMELSRYRTKVRIRRSQQKCGEEVWASDPYGRNFAGMPPDKTGDYAWFST